MRLILSWLSDVYQKSGYVAVLIALIVIVALVLAVSLVGHVGIGDIAKWLAGVGG